MEIFKYLLAFIAFLREMWYTRYTKNIQEVQYNRGSYMIKRKLNMYDSSAKYCFRKIDAQ